MIYYYLVRVSFLKGNSIIVKDYHRTFLDIGELFCYLEENHKGNYTLISIKEKRYFNLFM